MSWMIGYLYPQKNISTLEANLKETDPMDAGSHSINRGVIYYIDWVINTLSAPIFMTYRTLSNYILRRSPDAAYAPNGNKHILYSKNPSVFKEVFRYHRHDPKNGILANAFMSQVMTSVMSKIYPSIKSNDIILSCTPEYSKKYRDFLNQFFSTESIKKYIPTIETIIKDKVLQWGKNEAPLVLNKEIKLLAMTLMSRVFLGYSGPCEDISKASSNIISWLSDEGLTNFSPLYSHLINILPKFIKLTRLSAEDRIYTKKIIRAVVDNAIKEAPTTNKNETLIQELMNAKFTQEQIQAMILTLFVAGQDNVSTSLTHALLKLAQDPFIQQEIINEKKSAFDSKNSVGLLCESLRVLCPVGGVSRTVCKPVELTLTNKKNEHNHISLQKGDDIHSMILWAARDPSLFPNPDKFDIKRHQKKFLANLHHLPFGSGAHLCPGWYMHYLISTLTIFHLVQNYKISTSFKGEPKTQAGFVTTLADTITVSLQKRQ